MLFTRWVPCTGDPVLTAAQTLLGKKRGELELSKERLEKGITTLQKTQTDVAELKTNLEETLVRVEEKKEATQVLIKKMGEEKAKVEEQQAIASKEEEKAMAVARNANEIKAECDKDLAAALPIMEKAKEAVKCLTRDSLSNLKALASPPQQVCVFAQRVCRLCLMLSCQVLDVTKAVLILKNNERRNFSWNNAKKMLSNPNSFLAELGEFKAEEIPEEVLQRLAPVLKIKVRPAALLLEISAQQGTAFQLRVDGQNQQRCG